MFDLYSIDLEVTSKNRIWGMGRIGRAQECEEGITILIYQGDE